MARLILVALSMLAVVIGGMSGPGCSTARAATTKLYIAADSGTDVAGDAGVTNLTSGNNTDPIATNASFSTLFRDSAPTATTSSNMREDYTTAGTWYTLGRVYFASPSSSATTLSANAVGKFYLRSNTAANDKFQFVLHDYNPAAGNGVDGTVINTVTDVGSPGNTYTLVTVNFTNAAYTLPQGHYLQLEIRFKPSVNGNTGRVACDSTSNPSYLDIGMKYTVTSSSGANGSITGPTTTPGVANVDRGDSPVYSCTANAGYMIQNLMVDGATVAGAIGRTTYSHTFPAVSANHTISVSYIVESHTFTVSPGTGGSISLPAFSMSWAGGTTTSYTVAGGGILNFLVTPDANYGIGAVYVNGVAQGVPAGQTVPYTLSVDIASTSSITASFLPYHTVTASAGTGGSIDPVGSSSVLNGDDITFDIVANSGYRLLSITDNGVTVPNPTSTYTILNVTSDHTVVATFQRVYTISAGAGSNGVISPVGDVSVDSGSSRNFSMSGDLGFKVSDVVVDGVSVGAVTSYQFSNVTADHTITVTFEAAPSANAYSAIPPFISTSAPANVMLMMSVETPMQGPANPNVTCTGTPSSLSYSCSTSSSSCSSNGSLGCYSNIEEYYGYFESSKCYSYSGSGATGLFSPSGAATNHQCSGTAWSGNFLNWMSTTAVDAFRRAFTGGNRTVDVAGGDTVLLAARLDSNGWFPDKVYVDNSELYTPYSGTRYFKRENVGIGFGICNSGQTDCTVTSTGSGETQWPSAGANTQAVFSLRIKACDSTGGVEARCNSITNKPEGTIQKYMDKVRFALMSYAADNDQSRDGGVLRSVMKWVGPTIPNGIKYHDASGSVVTCSASSGCVNPEREVETTGTFRSNPAGASGVNSGIVNYINKFAYVSGYKSHDPMSEMYYEVVRYFKNLTPSVNKYCSGLTTASNGDGFAFYCDASKSGTWGWRDPTLYPCSQNFVVAINDANPWLDKRIPGSAFIGSYGGSAGGGNDWCGSSQGACDSDFLQGGSQVNVEEWTNMVGDKIGLTGTTMNVACEVDASGACIGGFSTGKNVVISKLGRIIGTPPYPAKENSYNVAGLAYYANQSDLRTDVSMPGKQNLETFMIDTQEPASSMLVGPKNMLNLAAMYGGFRDMDSDASAVIGGIKYNTPFRDVSCDPANTNPNPKCAEWDEDHNGIPDNYFFASKAARVENALNSAFSKILNRVSSGTAAAVANNRSGERGANIIQALFYPGWPNDKNIKWLGEVQALWYYLDPVISYSTIRQDSDGDRELDLTMDQVPGDDPFQTNAIWKAGAELHKRTATDRNIYSLLDSSQTNLTNSVNSFATANRAALKPLMNISSLTDTQADALINYARGLDSNAYRSRTVTNGATTACWKLGDVINSTPQVQSIVPANAYHQIYVDTSYSQYISATHYAANNMVYAGANDGMLHGFRLGKVQKVTDNAHPFRIAEIVDDTDLGKEEWAFVPNNALPYLKNFADQSYGHQYIVDGAPLIVDASINKHTDCTESNYWSCDRKTTYVSSTKDLDSNKTSWRSLLVGSMGLGGATREGDCNETLNHDLVSTNNIDCIQTPVANGGYSSFFALDVTDSLAPKHLWEFSDAVLPAADKGIGLTTTGVAIVRINAISGSPARANSNLNGRWFAVFASGPTGTIDSATRQFLGRSDQNLKIYVVDLNPFSAGVTTFVKNTNYWVFDTGLQYAFANSVSGAAVDVDRSSSNQDGYYSDDVVYVTYTRASLDNSVPKRYPIDWDKGGVVRLVTNNDPNPANWFVSQLIDDIGPVTTSIGKLQDKNKKKLWIYFGEGRYFYKGDNQNDVRRLFAVADPCYSYDLEHLNRLSDIPEKCPAVVFDGTNFKDQTINPSATLDSTNRGWYVSMEGPSGTSGAERMVSDVTAAQNGIVFYTTYIPDSDACAAGGHTSLWAMKYDSGSTPPSGGLKGKAPLQTSSGGITMVDLATSFTQSWGRKLDPTLSPAGMAPKGRFPPLLQPKPVRRVLNIQER